MANQPHPEPDHDQTLADSFPASDPPANTGITGAGKPDKPPHQRDPHQRDPHQRDIEERPTGTPTSDRHATEIAHQWEHEAKSPAKP